MAHELVSTDAARMSADDLLLFYNCLRECGEISVDFGINAGFRPGRIDAIKDVLRSEIDARKPGISAANIDERPVEARIETSVVGTLDRDSRSLLRFALNDTLAWMDHPGQFHARIGVDIEYATEMLRRLSTGLEKSQGS